MRYVFFLLLLTAQTAFGQCCPYMKPVQVLPANPTATDDVRLVFQASTGGLGVQVNAGMVRVGNAFTYTGCYYNGILTVPKSYTDTVRIGQLSPGSYTVSFIGIESNSSQQCIEQRRNSTSATFQVSGVLSTRGAAEGWGIFPVPVTGRSLSLLAPADQSIRSLQLLDAAGRTCRSYSATQLVRQANQWQLSLPVLPAGLYFLRVNAGSGQQLTHRVQLQ
jgi:hypothetical protein